jgi:hypothetical protein
MGRPIKRGRCRYDGKTTFTSFDAAAGVLARLGGGRPYWCAHAGGWHITGKDRADYARARSAVA